MSEVVFLHGYFRAIPFQWATGEMVVFIQGKPLNRFRLIALRREA